MKEKAHKIAQEIVAIASNEKSVDETPFLNEFVSEHTDEASELADRLTNAERSDFLFNKLKSLNGEQEQNRLIQEIEKIRRRGKRKLIITISSVAAAILAVSFLLMYEKPAVVIDRIVATADITTPVIITDKGETILLNEMGDSILTRQLHKIKKNGLNNLSYETSLDTIQEPEYNELKIPIQHNYTVSLSDGTVVTLNAGSSLRYPVNFFGDKREVELKGEAYFKVAKSKKPFIVNSDIVSITVYGTEFNINSNAHGVKTALVEGSIGVNIDGFPEVIMKPNQLFSFDKKSCSYSIKEEDATIYTRWTDGNFNYLEMPFEDVLNDLSRWYGINFNIMNKIDDLNITLFASRNTTADEMFEFIEMLTNVKFIKEGVNLYSINKIK